MTLLEQIDADIKTAMKEKNEIAVSAIRNLKAALKNAEISKRAQLNDDDALKVIAKKVKQHKDSIESFQAGNRTDLASFEQAQMQTLEKYLPRQMSEAQVAKIVADVIGKSQATSADFGKVMKEVMGQVFGKVDGDVVTKIVKENLK